MSALDTLAGVISDPWLRFSPGDWLALRGRESLFCRVEWERRSRWGTMRFERDCVVKPWMSAPYFRQSVFEAQQSERDLEWSLRQQRVFCGRE